MKSVGFSHIPGLLQCGTKIQKQNLFHSPAGNTNQQLSVSEGGVLSPESVCDENRCRAGSSNLRRGLILLYKVSLQLGKFMNVSKYKMRALCRGKSKDGEGVNLPALWFCLIVPSGGQHCCAHH